MSMARAFCFFWPRCSWALRCFGSPRKHGLHAANWRNSDQGLSAMETIRFTASSLPLMADSVEKVFLGCRTKILRAADAFYAQRREGTISFHPKSITDLRSGAKKRRSGREVQRSTFARFFWLFDF